MDKDLLKRLSQDLEVMPEIIEDIYKSLHEEEDIRDTFEDVELKTNVLKFEDLKIGDELTGVVRNVVDFGAFVDLGISSDGLLHISQVADKFVKNIHDELSVGDRITVKILDIDVEKERVSLTRRNIIQN